MSTQIEASTNALALIEVQPIENLFKPETIDPILVKIALEVRAPKFDITKEVDRKACASLAFKLAKTRTFIDECRLKLVSAEKKRLKLIDQEGSRIWDELEALQKEVRKPLTDYENAEKDRIERNEAHILQLGTATNFDNYPTTDQLRSRIAELEADNLTDMREFTDRARACKEGSLKVLQSKLAASIKADEDRVELDRLRKEQEVRAQKEREQSIAAKAKADAEAAAERKIQEAREAKVRAEKAAAELVAKAERDAETARVKAQREKELAVQREKDRVAAEKKAEEVATARREANKAHCAKINRQVLDALVAEGITESVAIKVIQLVAKGKIPNVTITY
jgi:hypothetical protein